MEPTTIALLVGYIWGFSACLWLLAVIGPRENVFHFLPNISVFRSWSAFRGELL